MRIIPSSMALRKNQVCHIQIPYQYCKCLKAIVVGVIIGAIITVLLATPQSKDVIKSAANSLRSTNFKFPIKHDVMLSPNDVMLSPNDVMISPSEVVEEQCRPHQHIFYLKTHKCGSSTVQNVLLRFGVNHNLTFALPEKGNYFGYPNTFRASNAASQFLPSSGKVDIFAIHTRLGIPLEYSKILHIDTKWITIVRDAPSLYESLFHTAELGKFYGFELDQYKNKSMSDLMSLKRYSYKFGKNQMLFDMGYDDKSMTATELKEAINKMDDLFDLVLISEFMDESLILLRHFLCWSLDDVVVFKKNARREEVKPSMDPETVKVLRELNSADVLLYDHFLARHKSAVLEFGANRMAEEVSALHSLTDKYYTDCGVRELNGHDSSLKDKECSSLVNAYVPANNSDQNCVMLSLPEKPFVDVLRERQLKMLHRNINSTHT